MIDSPPPALLLIDVQQGLDDPRLGARNNPDAERQMAVLLAAWRKLDWPIVHVQHMSQEPLSPLCPGLPGNVFKPEVMPRDGEAVFQKRVSSAFIGTDLEPYLRHQGISDLVIVGLTTDHCVSTSVRMAGNLGFKVIVVEDATATHERTGPDGVHYSAGQVHRLALASLYREFADVDSTANVLQRLRAAAVD